IRTLYSADSKAAVLVKPTTPCFEATYGLNPPSPDQPASEDVLITLPNFCSCITRNTCLRPRNAPTRLTFKTCLKFSTSKSVTLFTSPSIPALLKKTSILPHLSKTVCTYFSTSSSLVTSAAIDITSPYVFNSSTAESSASSDKSTKATLAP